MHMICLLEVRGISEMVKIEKIEYLQFFISYCFLADKIKAELRLLINSAFIVQCLIAEKIKAELRFFSNAAFVCSLFYC